MFQATSESSQGLGNPSPGGGAGGLWEVERGRTRVDSRIHPMSSVLYWGNGSAKLLDM